jgi:two-component system, OmpR family, sensor histidine kinase MtrB|tara:strand:- start:3404 stop:4972 length:1569 start_codon:yes stop_codon:yes gene_type:complete
MKGIRQALRQSLAVKVILSTVLLSLSVILLAGSALNSRLSDGIRSVSLTSAIAESRFTFFNAQYQMLLSQGETLEERRQIIADLVLSATTKGVNEAQREMIFLKAPNGNKSAISFEMSSSMIKVSSVPAELRTKVQENTELQYQYGIASYTSGVKGNSLFVGERINIPGGGRYEMYLVFSLKSQTATLDLVRNSLFLTGLALLVLITMITWLVLRQVVRPVRDAARIATQFTKGDFSQRMKITSQDEISTLAHSYNEMAYSIEQQISRLENLSRVQQRFVSDVTHELRTPLTTLRMASEVIYNQRESFDPFVSRSSELLAAQIDRFEKLLEDLLEVSRFDAEVAVLEAVNIDVIALVNRCVRDFGPGENHNNALINVVCKDSSIHIRADVRRVERIMRNLLANALDHADGKEVVVTIVTTETEVAIGVRDYGSGLDESALIRVFDRFWRADPSRARFRGGTGLGLSIALEDARLHNGELDAWGRPNKGAHFVLTLPLIAGSSIQARPISITPKDFHQESFYL